MDFEIKNKKNLAALSASILSVAVVGVLFFAPVKAFDFPGSMHNHLESVNQLNELNDEKRDAYKKLDTLRVDSKNKEIELETSTKSAEKAQELFSELLAKQKKTGDWSYHLPSLLIQLEKFADDTHTKVALQYDTFNKEGKYVSSSNQGLKYIDAKVQVYGDYNDVNKYIKKVENVDFLSVEDLTLNQVKDGDLAGTFSLKIYYMGE